jgi:hypothetical protein
MQYLPPKISIEGHGIKRGLTAVEAAILMEQPLDKVMTMILFGVIKKGAAQVTKRDPLEIQVNEPLPEKLHEYEKDFLSVPRGVGCKNTPQGLAGDDSETRPFGVRENEGFQPPRNAGLLQKHHGKSLATGGSRKHTRSQKQDVRRSARVDDARQNYDDRTRRVFTGPVIVPTFGASL